MHYYTFSPKDYMSKTSFLEPMEDLAYRRMLDYCYLNEKALPSDIEEIALLVRMRTHSECIATVLRYFFELTDDGYINNRAVREICAYQEKSDKARESALARWDKRKSKTQPKPNDSKGLSERNANACETHDERNANYKLITINDELETKTTDAQKARELNIPFDDFWTAYDKKEDRARCEKKWKLLTDSQREQTMSHVPSYVASTPDKKFRKNPSTYLNNESWDNEITNNQSNQQGNNNANHQSANSQYQQQPKQSSADAYADSLDAAAAAYFAAQS